MFCNDVCSNKNDACFEKQTAENNQIKQTIIIFNIEKIENLISAFNSIDGVASSI